MKKDSVDNSKQNDLKLKYDTLLKDFKEMQSLFKTRIKELESSRKSVETLTAKLAEAKARGNDTDENRQYKQEIKKLEDTVAQLKKKPEESQPSKNDYKITDYKQKVEELLRINMQLRDELEQKSKNQSQVMIIDGEQDTNYKIEIAELKAKLSRKGTDGKPRNNNTTNADVIAMRSEGATIRDIVKNTRLSSATIIKILKSK